MGAGRPENRPCPEPARDRPAGSMTRGLAPSPSLAQPGPTLSWSDPTISGQPISGLTVRVHDGLPDGVPQLSVLEVIDLFLGLVPRNFYKRMAAVEEEIGRVTCVVSDGFWGFAGDLAAERGALWVTHWCCCPKALLAHLCTDLLRQSAGPDGDRARVQDALDSIPGLSSMRIEDLPEGIVLSDTASSLALLKPVKKIAEGLQASGTPFLWSLKEIAWGHLPADFLDYVASRGLIVPWAPQPQVLEHSAVGAFLTHGGWNSVLDGITAGVPMIIKPYLGDQFLDARMVTDVWNIGVGFEGGVIKKDEMVNALNVILGSKRGKTMKEKINELKSMALQGIKPGGSSTKNLDALEKMVASCQHN
ncbi:myricetin 3-O-rhamnosyltransferase UGT77B2-like [Dioscorea cayenensis subsp. rotundata]|uniref:Myricetin 3-O-rhamnosyltransferase UGT77B2-like n=1 Tax=Dioscorea cayennensis subsp. rotundata TaxID=55577 RepID=A0AB40ARG1_DIOCR|nr:myricetin 3-O-rhamnosyltransferase UGT77B2-like [Dioscorea cayenensis subsp. rotundata]